MSTGLAYDERFLLHDAGDLPERPERLRFLMAHLQEANILSRLVRIAAKPAPLAAVRRVHTEKYLTRFQEAVNAHASTLDNDDVVIGPHSWDSALLAAGGVLAMCDAVAAGRVENGFCAVRPPGHHAEAGMAMGFCLLNNVAIAARHLQHRHHLKKVAIVDWDVHHGNGTQHIFEEDPSVFFISLHEHPDFQYPGTGYAAERGRGPGAGFTLNLPLLPGTDDAPYQTLFTRRVLPALRRFAPDALLISAGFDAHFADPLGHLRLTPACFAWMTRRLKSFAQAYCHSRLISVLEGGYNLQALADSIAAHLETLLEPAKIPAHQQTDETLIRECPLAKPAARVTLLSARNKNAPRVTCPVTNPKCSAHSHMDLSSEETMSQFSRRDFVKHATAVAAAMQLPTALNAQTQTATTSAPAADAAAGAALHWLESPSAAPACFTGATWGVPWPRGTFKSTQTFALQGNNAQSLPVQTWPLAYWPDGSLKWTAHALAPTAELPAGFHLNPGTPVAPATPLTIQNSPDTLTIDTGLLRCTIPKKGQILVSSIERAGKPIAENLQLVCLRQDRSGLDNGMLRQEKYTGVIDSVTLEQNGPIRAVVRITGKHEHATEESTRAWLPFTLRLYFYAGAESLRLMHTFIYDGDQYKDFIQGLGLTFTVPLRDLFHDRHVRFVGESPGLWAEPVRNLSGLRRDAGLAIQRQFDGLPCPPVAQMPAVVREHLQDIAAWNDYTLVQSSADSFEIRKRAGDWGSWLVGGNGRRAAGLGYVGGVTGGVAFALRDFWQRHPTQLDIRNAATDNATVTLWLWSPEAAPMDLRPYDNKPHNLDISYEDWEEGFSTPTGIARTSEINLWALAATPPRQRLVEFAAAAQAPPQMVCEPAHYHAARVFGALWSLPDRSSPAKTRIEDELDFFLSFYMKQVDYHHWYGFWNYGDIMHTYDKDRHKWRYDVGGYAWDNSELSPDLWLWFTFLRSGRADVFRFAEAMTRHTGEVDVYHLGRFAGLGSRHAVLHWADSAKQVRVSLSEYRRMYYYLTADERVGDLMRELLNSDFKVAEIDPDRKVAAPIPFPARIGFGPDWFAFVSNWLTEWERTGDTKWRDKIIAGMKSLGAMPHGLFSGPLFGYDPKTGQIFNANGNAVAMTHLACVFGGVEISAELADLITDVPEWDKAWLQYCRLYNAPVAERAQALGQRVPAGNLIVGHSRLTAYVAAKTNDPALAQRAWQEFLRGDNRREWRSPSQTTARITGPQVLVPLEEAPWISTNDVAQWALAAIQNLALVGDTLPPQDTQ